MYEIDSKNPEIEKAKDKAMRDAMNPYIADKRNAEALPKVRIEENPELADFYTTYDPLNVTKTDKKNYEKYLESIEENEKKMIAQGGYFYQLDFKNVGGLIMPIIIEMEFEDGTKETRKFPAEIWKGDNEEISKIVYSKKKVKQFSIDPYREMADTEEFNNNFPRKTTPTRFEIYKYKSKDKENPMQQSIREREREVNVGIRKCDNLQMI